MALENCNITESTFNANVDTNLSSRTLSERTLTITAEEGYVISASDFTLPDPANVNGITGISAQDTAFPGEPDNTVQVTLTMDTGFNATAENNTITLGITGAAKRHEQPLEDTETIFINGFVFINEVLTNVQTPSRSTPTGIGFSGTNIRIDKVNTALRSGVTTTIASYTFTAATGNRFLSVPTIELVSNRLEDKNNASLFLVVTGTTQTADGNITAYNVNLDYFSNVDVYDSDLVEYNLIAQASAIPTDVTEIKKVDFGSKNVSKHGSHRRIKVYGNSGARFNVTAKETGQSAFSSTDHVIKQQGKFFGKSKGLTVEEVYVDIPAKSTSTTYDIIVTATSPTAFNTTSMGSSGGSARTFVINQSANPTFALLIAISGIADYVLSASSPNSVINRVGRPNRTADQLSYLKNLDLDFEISYEITAINNQTLSIVKTPEFEVKETFGEVKSNDLDRIYLNSTSGLVTGMKVVEHGVDTTVPARVINSISANQYVDVSTNLSAGVNKEFTFVKSDWGPEIKCVPHLNGGTKWSVSGITIALNNTNTNNKATVKARARINKFGTSTVATQLILDNILSTS